jgi:pyruvate dehydrogenase E2 component (dihydrolipoamide acetyltransferase)
VARAIVMPSMGMYTEEGVLTAWLRPSGTRVTLGEPVAEITTEKATFEIPAPEAGILHTATNVGTTLQVEAMIGYILGDGESVPTARTVSSAPVSQLAAQLPSDHSQISAVARTLRATPVAKRMAAQHQVDLKQVVGSGPGGRIVEADIQTLIAKRGLTGRTLTDPMGAERSPMTGSRRSLAERLRNTLATAASTTLTRQANADFLVIARQRLAEKLGQAPSYDALFIKLFAVALREHPEFNAVIEGDSIVRLGEINVGFAVSVPNGLIVPVVPNADSAPFKNVVETVRSLTDRALAGRMQPADVEAGTATISNLGIHGVDAFTPILNGSQSVILGIGRIVQSPIVRSAELAIGHTCVLSLTFDHRVADGVPAALLLNAVVRRMSDEQFFTSLGGKSNTAALCPHDGQGKRFAHRRFFVGGRFARLRLRKSAPIRSTAT